MSDIFELPSNAKNDRVRIEQQQQKAVEFTYLGQERKVPGHKMFSYNLKTGEVKEAEYERCLTIDFTTRKPLKNDKIIVEKNCVYRQSLNKKNFIKRLKREGII